MIGRGIKKAKNQYLGSVYGVQTTEKVIALTFDDGPHPYFTPIIIDLLEKYDAKATFFMVGKTAMQYPSIVERIGSGGNTVANHSWDHPAFPSIKRRERINQVMDCERALGKHATKLFRPPYGYQNIYSYYDIKMLKYVPVVWTHSIRDWIEQDANTLLEKLENILSPGIIILLHDSIYDATSIQRSDRNELIKALDVFLANHSREYKFVTVPELFRYGKILKSAWFNVPESTLPGARKDEIISQ
jgi:peptidoglycan-N-acetylglucosamine deacetylase